MLSCLIAITALAASAAPAQAAGGQYYLLVGVASYQSYESETQNGIPWLKGPDMDCDMLKAELDKLGWKPLPGTAGVLKSLSRGGGDSSSLPTRERILSSLTQAQNLRADDDFLFFYSGHGMRFKGQDYLQPYNSYLAPGPSSSANRNSWPVQTSSCISFEADLKGIFGKIPARRRAVILNMCRSEMSQFQAMGFGGEEQPMSFFFGGGAVENAMPPLIMRSSEPGQASYAPDNYGVPTLFAEHFLNALRDPANQNESLVDLVRVLRNARDRILEFNSRTQLPYGPMVPVMEFNGHNSFLLGSRGGAGSDEFSEAFQKGIEWHEKGYFGTAEESFRKALRINPNSGAVQGWLGVALHHQNKNEEAAPYLRRAIELEPKTGWLHYWLGMSTTDTDEQIAAFTQATVLNPNDDASHLGLGWAHFYNNDYSKAKASYNRSLEINPRLVPAIMQLGWIALLEQDYPESEARYLKSVTLEPRNFWAWLHLGTARYFQGKHTSALEAYQKAVDIDPENATAQSYLGLACDVTQNYAKAEQHYKRALELDSKLAHAYINYHSMLITLGRTADANRLKDQARANGVEIG